jgi:hypothetical protein
MRFQVAGHGADDFALRVFRHQMPRLPAGAAADRFRQFHGMQKLVRNEWVEAISSGDARDQCSPLRIRFNRQIQGAGIPALGGNIADGRNHTEAKVIAHAERQFS